MTESVGSQGFIGIGKESEAGSAVEPTVYLAFDSETLAEAIDRAEAEGITGTRGRSKLRSVQTLKKPGGGFSLSGIKVEDLPLLLELALGGAATGGSLGSIGLTETLSTFTVVVFKNVKKFTYAGCKMGKASLSSSASNQLLRLSVENIVAMTEAIADNDLTPSYVSTQRPLTHRDSTLSVDSTPIAVEEIRIDVENTLDDNLFRNSQTRLYVAENDRKVGGQITVGWNSDNYTSALALFYSGATGAITVSWTDGTRTLAATLPYVYFTGETPQIGGRGVMNMNLPFEAKDSADGANDSLVIVLS